MSVLVIFIYCWNVNNNVHVYLQLEDVYYGEWIFVKINKWRLFEIRARRQDFHPSSWHLLNQVASSYFSRSICRPIQSEMIRRKHIILIFIGTISDHFITLAQFLTFSAGLWVEKVTKSHSREFRIVLPNYSV